jgi:hypothetical protein
MQKINNKVLAIFDNDSNKKIIQVQNQFPLIVCGYADAGFNFTINDATVKVIVNYPTL